MTPLERAALAHVQDIRDGRAWAESFARLAKVVDAFRDTDPPPAEEPDTRPATPEARKRSEPGFKAVTVARILDEGKPKG